MTQTEHAALLLFSFLLERLVGARRKREEKGAKTKRLLVADWGKMAEDSNEQTIELK